MRLRGLFALALLLSVPAFGRTLLVATPEQLSPQLAAAQEGDTLLLAPGQYTGPLTLDKPLTLVGQPGTELVAVGGGSVLVIDASDVTVRGMTVKGASQALFGKTAGIQVLAGHERVRLEANRIEGQGFGIRADGARHLKIRRNHIGGDPALALVLRGDGIHLNGVEEAWVEENRIERVRDGVYLESSRDISVRGNLMADQQYPLHLMYAEGIQAWDNQAENVAGGWALMDSKEVELHHNSVTGAREFGILLNMTEQARVWENRVKGVHNPDSQDLFDGQGKGLFIYGASGNTVFRNRFEDSEIGIMMALGGEDNQLYANAFVHNRTQVKYLGEQTVVWSHCGVGNYWSGYDGYDLDGNGVGDTPFRPNDDLDRLFWLYPEARFLLDSPVVRVIRYLLQRRPAATGPGVVDLTPLMTAPLSTLESPQ
ncbi:nitrous oxide reductase family maturation protein NosD [Ferrimonas balearica]|uniref:nitrous oxide reductase family maturation protein NosD n=1 Tax=Ferrimonas balearica TaxID=44012 RepID=UPI001C997077|nr:nitrous oxide reductase family maturation protein NosD [Ferrimonas balearica]MBY5991358.1 nitrous oxide reductase family maturation protein NosD [Ferrimonas balearica]